MAARGGVERGSTVAPRQPALVKPSRRTPTQYNSSQKQGQKPELACTDILGHTVETSPNRKDGPSGTPQGDGIVRPRIGDETAGTSANKLGQAAADGLRQSYSC